MSYRDLRPLLLTLPQSAELVGLSDDTLRREVKRGNLRVSRIGRCVRVTPEELNRWRLATVENAR